MRESGVGCSPCRKRIFCASVPVPFAADLWTGVFSEVAIFVFFTEPRRLTGPRGESPDLDCFRLSTTVLHTVRETAKKVDNGSDCSKDFKCLHCFPSGCYSYRESLVLYAFLLGIRPITRFFILRSFDCFIPTWR